MARIAALVWGSIVIAGLLAPVTAAAHEPGDYWRLEWRSQDRGTTAQRYEFTEEVPGDANGAFADRVAGGRSRGTTYQSTALICTSSGTVSSTTMPRYSHVTR
jgi:hypothetical protein